MKRISYKVNNYYKDKPQYIGRILFSSDPLVNEVIQYAKDQNYKFPKKSYIIGIFLMIKKEFRKSMKLLRKILTKLRKHLSNYDTLV